LSHLPERQTPSQHCDPVEHTSPYARHAASGPHRVPPALAGMQLFEQQWLEPEHSSPMAAHGVVDPLQTWVDGLHEFEQHAALSAHVWPTILQTPVPQTWVVPLTIQAVEQQSAAVVHGALVLPQFASA
jgi:hypothetical protein